MNPSKRNRLGRRHFLLATAATAATVAPQAILLAAPEQKVLLSPSGENDLFRVRIEVEANGNVNVPENPLISRKEKMKLPLKSDAVFDYEERLRRPEQADAASEVTLAERYYHTAESTSQLGRNQQVSELRPSVRETIVRRETLPEVIYSVDDYFRQSELELLRAPASSVAIDRLLPVEAVEVGSTYAPDQEVLVSVLNLSSVEASDLEAEVVEISATDAKIHFRGKVDGSVDGVPTVIRAVGKLTFNRVLGTCTWLAMAIHETREISKAEPGFDISATVKLLRKPLDRPIALPAVPPALSLTEPIGEDRLYVELRSEQLGVSVLMDRRWRMMTDVPGAAMMRMIDSDRSIAQCDYRPLASLQPGNHWTLEAFQQDVRRTLGEQLSELIEADQRLSDGGMRVLRVTAHGAVQGVPIQWVFLHFSDDSGRRVLATFTMEGANIGEFAGSDLQLAGSLRWVEKAVAESPDQPEKATADAGEPEAETAKADPKPEIEVQSASDLR